MRLLKTEFLLLALITLCSGCYTAKKYPYTLSDPNKAIIKKVFTTGKVSCTDGYCWQVTNEGSDKQSYLLNGKRVLFMNITVKAEDADKSKSFIAYIKITNLGVRLRKIEELFLEELGQALYNENQEQIESVIKTIIKVQNERNKKQ